MDDTVLIADIGKTRTKLTLLTAAGGIVAARDCINRHRGGRLDHEGIARWLSAEIDALAKLAPVRAIVPVAHGATAALVAEDDRVLPVFDYEAEPDRAIAEPYNAMRDPFEETLSPRLPAGLNLGVQLHWQDRLAARGQILLWPQFWAWWLSGERAAERTSLGCHTDLWQPAANTYSRLAQRQGWAERFPPLRGAGETLDTVKRSLAPNLPPDCAVLSGLHDSNAALHAIRGHASLKGRPVTVVSTGTWFVAMRTGGTAPTTLNPNFDCLGNVDVAGAVVPTARFMGGRDYETLMGDEIGTVATLEDAANMLEGEPLRYLERDEAGGNVRLSRDTSWQALPASRRAALASLYLALNTDLALDHIGATGAIVIEGRFARDPLFPAMLARLRPGSAVHVCDADDGVALGAARLWWPDLAPPFAIRRVEAIPLAIERLE